MVNYLQKITIINMDLFKNIREKAIKTARGEVLKEFVSNMSAKPKKGNALDRVIAEQLERTERKIGDWRSRVQCAEDILNPDRLGLMEYYRDFADDYQLHAVRQNRTLQAISGKFHFFDKNNKIDEEVSAKFITPNGTPMQWFRDLMSYIMDAKSYGWEAIQLGPIENGVFSYAKKIPEENTIPYFDSMIENSNQSFVEGGHGVIDFSKDPFDTWVIRTGSTTDLGLINKCAPYIIYKSVFGNWSQHVNVFGMPLKVGKTDLKDNERKQNMIDAFEAATGASYIIQGLMDDVEVIEQKGGGDPHNIYGKLIEKCDAAISKVYLSQTGTTDEKAYSGSANVHANVESSIVYSDKLDIENVVNNKLIPRMKKIGIIPADKYVYGAWEYSEKLTITQWTDVITRLSAAGFSVPAEEASKRVGIELDETIVAVPDATNFSLINKIKNMYENG